MIWVKYTESQPNNPGILTLKSVDGAAFIADVDNNGKNEVIAASGKTIYMWETNGSSTAIEWGSERHDSQNTGEYFKVCQATIINSNTTWNSNQEH